MTEHSAQKCAGAAPLPTLVYSWLNHDGVGVWGDGPDLATVREVSAYILHNETLRVTARGDMLRKDGGRGPRRCLVVDLSVAQPAWLEAIAADARQRLNPNIRHGDGA